MRKRTYVLDSYALLAYFQAEPGSDKRLPVELADVTMERVLGAAQIKAHHAVSYADCFAVSLAKELEASVVTGDPEFRKVGALVSLVWL